MRFLVAFPFCKKIVVYIRDIRYDAPGRCGIIIYNAQCITLCFNFLPRRLNKFFVLIKWEKLIDFKRVADVANNFSYNECFILFIDGAFLKLCYFAHHVRQNSNKTVRL